MVFEWKNAAHIGVAAQLAGETCERLEKTVGLTAKNLVEDSRPEAAPLHPAFEWDDQKAAEKWRENQAYRVINCLVVRPEERPKETVRAFFTVEPQKYESLNVILQCEEKSDALLDMAKRELEAFERKYRMLQELAGVMEEADKVLRRVP